jgi:hypothetical protein
MAQADPCNNQACPQSPFSQAGGPYVGDWGAHGEHVVVNADGSGTETSNYGTVNFRMTFVSTSDPTASGNVTGGAKQAGYVTMQLVDSGNGMLFLWAAATKTSRSANWSVAPPSTAPTAAPRNEKSKMPPQASVARLKRHLDSRS